ncbi:hypothetical protein EVAR_97249_1 [Eumeta japonica]|uniref:Transposable element P transposase-like RNase H domain-containing protein n=1 Tax=Eumeta variegata TaxID=151549 RepID=A0A4C1ZF20_EUMVA|nr:hypothetical protein EVAR_97249_1 [Eumeta japonica]
MEAFKALKLKCQSKEKPVVCSLVFDEMAIRTQKLFVKQKLGAVNFGAGPQESVEQEQIATQALVFIVTTARNESPQAQNGPWILFWTASLVRLGTYYLNGLNKRCERDAAGAATSLDALY